MLADASERFHLRIAVELAAQVIAETLFAAVTAQLAPSGHRLVLIMVLVADLARKVRCVSVGKVLAPEAFKRRLLLPPLLHLIINFSLQGCHRVWVYETGLFMVASGFFE